jgi:predicted DNA-binding transcriptional regulator YafY
MTDPPPSTAKRAYFSYEAISPAPLRPGADGKQLGLSRKKVPAKNIKRTRERYSGEHSELPKNAGFSRFPIERMQRLHELLSANRFPNCRKMAVEFEVSTKTIQRDLNFMRDRLRLPLEYDRIRYGFRYTRPVDHPPITFSALKKRAAEAGNTKKFASRPLLPDGVEQPPIGEAGAFVTRIRFDAEVAAELQVLESHSFQEMKVLADGSIEMEVRLDSVIGLERWVLGWGSHAQVLEPEWLRRRILRIARLILNSYHKP